MKQKQFLEVIYNGNRMKVRSGKFMNFLQGLFRTNRKHKDQLFIKLFSEKNVLLSLYNAVNHSSYTNPEDLEITTMEDTVYMGMKNDCSFLIGNYMNLYEHQSSFNPNMPLRGFLYFSGLIQAYLALNEDCNIYGEKLVKIPTPRYIVFYIGTKDYPDETQLKLSDAFENEDGCMEFTARMLNINQGHNTELMAQCKALAEYAEFVKSIRNYKNMGMSDEESIDAACDYCINHDILRNFLIKNRNEVRQLILTEYNPKKHMKLERKQAREEGLRTKVIDQVRKKYSRHLSVDVIAEHVEEDVELVQKICSLLDENPEISTEEILSKL